MNRPKNRARAAGAYMLAFLLWFILRCVQWYLPVIMAYGSLDIYPRATVICDAVKILALLAASIVLLMGRKNIALFIPVCICAVADMVQPVIAIVNGGVNVLTSIIVLCSISLIVVSAMAVFVRGSAVRSIWFIPGLLELGYLIYYAVIWAVNYGFSFADPTGLPLYSLLTLSTTAFGVSAYLYLGLWLKTDAEAKPAGIGYYAAR